MIDHLLNTLTSFLGSVLVIVLIILAYFINKWIFNRIDKEAEKGTVTYQIVKVIIILIGLLVFTITLPIEQELKGQIIGLIGIVLSAAFALSSTTLIGNALAGIMNNSIKNFKLGDFIRINDKFGRVTKKGLFRTEIQTEDRNLTSMPNMYIATNPLMIVRDSGTIISITVSLGYDVSRVKIEEALKEAALACGLTDPFVYITNLGDFSVTYKINGMLNDINKYFTTLSLLNAKVMDHLHKEEIEIVSPTFMNQRQVNETEFIPPVIREAQKSEESKLPEELIFDKAIEADKIEDKIESLERIEKQIKELEVESKETGNKESINKRIKHLKEVKERLNKHIVEQKNKLNEHK